MTKMIEVSYKPVLIQSSSIMEAGSGAHLQTTPIYGTAKSARIVQKNLMDVDWLAVFNQRFDVLLGIWTKAFAE